jgi:hypothetical protein
MFKKLKQLSATIIAILSLAIPMYAPALAHADSITDSVCSGVNTATGASGSCTDSSNNDSLTSVITKIIQVFSIVVGAVSVIMIIYGGFKYITSGGNDGNVSGAKNTIMYAVIGLVVVALAQVIVRYVLTKAQA